MTQTYTCLLPFDTDEPEFVRGFEAGRIWTQARDITDQFTATIHATNAEMILRIAEATGRTIQSRDLDDTWIDADFGAHPDF